MITAAQVFTPTGIPIHSYVKRDTEDYEGQLRNALTVQNSIVSLSGPSKSGKTVLLRKVVDPNDLIELTGATIRSADDLWIKLLSWCGAPIPGGISTTIGSQLQLGGKAGGKAGIPFVLEGQAEATAAASGTYSRQESEMRAVDLLALSVKEVGESSFIVFIDDFHYIPKDQQSEIAKQIKAASERGIKFVLASVPHRSDDAVRANSELRGRIDAIDVRTWERHELAQIAQNGFNALRTTVEADATKVMSSESYRSPQLMQGICLQACFRMKIDSDDHPQRHVMVPPGDLTAILQNTSGRSNFRSHLEALHAGPRQRGTERKEFALVDDTKGDVYRTILLALRNGEGALSLTYDQILDRVRDVCVREKESPVGSSIQTSLEHMSKIAAGERYAPAVLEWDDDRLDIIDPYFLFYLRHGTGLQDIVKA